jgi:hypothetical protein
VRIAMVLFQVLELIEVFGNYLRVEYLCHAFIMPSTKRNGMTGHIRRCALRCTQLAEVEPGETVRKVL